MSRKKKSDIAMGVNAKVGKLLCEPPGHTKNESGEERKRKGKRGGGTSRSSLILREHAIPQCI